ncbi:MAG: ribose 5-phosphate isomerase B [Bacteroidales bacterium]|nr:ribose 5-phosphate isomerase B [Bacteroidales bacterium]
MSKLIAIGSDHAGFKLKEYLKKYLESISYEVKDFGTNSENSVDYPDFVHPVARMVENKEIEKGIVICGTGNGVAMTANKHKSVRCALCWNKEIAKFARLHNDANMIALPARFISKCKAKKITKVFLETEFEGGRHINRIEKIAKNI